MRCRTVLALVAAVAVPAAARADDWTDGRPSDGYDVSVDLQGSVTFETFQGGLQPYGDWVVVGSYGSVWRPRVAAGWRPYHYGRWEWTNEGWMWVSDEPWGWAAYHYGRWAFDPYYGWIWVPGYEWAPAWVSWRVSGDVIGWAPLAPGFSVYMSSYPFIDFWWTFVPCVSFVSVPVHSVAYAPVHARQWFHATAPAPARPPRAGRFGPAGPAPAWGGPAPRVVEERIGRPITPARIVRAPSPGERARPGEIPVYRPERPGRDEAFTRRSFGPRPDDRPGAVPGGSGRGPGPVQAPGWGERRDGGGERRSFAPGGGGWRPEPRERGPAAAPREDGGNGGGRGSRDVQRGGGWGPSRSGGGEQRSDGGLERRSGGSRNGRPDARERR
jgi:hypothetical protein